MEEDVQNQPIDKNLQKQKTNLKQLLFSAEGRIGRSQYNIFILLVVLPTGVLVQVLNSPSTDPSITQILLTLLWWIVVLWTSIVMQIKRWHDRNNSGLWVFVSIIPLIGPLWTIISCSFLPGTVGDNKYGPPYNQESQ